MYRKIAESAGSCISNMALQSNRFMCVCVWLKKRRVLLYSLECEGLRDAAAAATAKNNQKLRTKTVKTSLIQPNAYSGWVLHRLFVASLFHGLLLSCRRYLYPEFVPLCAFIGVVISCADWFRICCTCSRPTFRIFYSFAEIVIIIMSWVRFWSSPFTW